DEEERDVLAPELGLERVEVAERHLREPGQERAEAIGEGAVVSRRQRAQSQPVEAVLARDDAAASGRGAAELDRGLDRLGSAAGEEHAAEARRRELEEALREQGRKGRDPELDASGRLQLERLDEGLADGAVVPAEVELSEPAEPVHVPISLRVPKI